MREWGPRTARRGTHRAPGKLKSQVRPAALGQPPRFERYLTAAGVGNRPIAAQGGSELGRQHSATKRSVDMLPWIVHNPNKFPGRALPLQQLNDKWFLSTVPIRQAQRIPVRFC